NRKRVLKTSELNEYMQEVIGAYPPPMYKGKIVRIKYVTQLKATVTTTADKSHDEIINVPQVPSFAFFCNLPQYIKDPYRRYIENKIRDKWDFSGTPINIFMREK
ncbi:MAG: hypothetical protein Q4B58_08160, partial [Bacteroidales bacterium]|nr:hypothetical protein [Bacteroidales bacterium]